MNKRWLVTIFTIFAISAIGLYGLFRIFFTFFSVIEASPIHRVSIILFALAETYILIHGIGYLSNIILAGRKYKRGNITYRLDTFPQIDVIIPAHNEEREVLEKTIIAAKYMDYPNFQIYVLDNCDIDEFKASTRAVCEELGVHHIITPLPRHGAKAGNVNEFLRLTQAPYLAVFDADYRPSRDFLKLLVPQMEKDKTIAYIQTPQFYSNIRDSVITKAAQMQQSIFYEYICEGKSVKNAVFMCGTNLLIRTKALKSIGGFDEDSVTEDFSSSLEISKAGWRTMYYNYTTAFGNGPTSLETYFKQQYRWARGTTGVFFKNLGAIFLRHDNKLTVSQRLEYLFSGTYYFSGFAWLVFMCSPPFYILFGMPVYFADATFYFFSYYPYFLFSTVLFFQALRLRNYYLSDVLRSQSLAYITAPVYARACIDALFKRKATFTVTKKDRRSESIHASLIPFQLFLIAFSAVAVLVGAIKVYAGDTSSQLYINIFWALFHIVILSYIFITITYEQRRARKEAGIH